jgi:ATP-binding cassette subfamily G (WHITE) protein 2 (SNQ2)
MTLFKRGPRTEAVVEAQEKAGVSDEEQGEVDQRTPEEKLRTDSGESISVPVMTDVFTWRNVQYDVNLKKGETRRLLDNISGFVAPGKLTALMGESGDVSSVVFVSMCCGIYMSGYCSGYVQQMDTHMAQTTVREALLFSAKLRQPPSVPLKEKEA